ncbi:MAG: hypothetical protein RMJ28_02815 [Nitrososphaerota archaeon]|nr:hypothetical protein [Candidatus Calditenuaceae archaeon]MDW8073152.1 hypothetical protein [Nitrososphaerota archaeon]
MALPDESPDISELIKHAKIKKTHAPHPALSRGMRGAGEVPRDSSTPRSRG